MKAVTVIGWGVAAVLLMIIGGVIVLGVAEASPGVAAGIVYVGPLFPLLLGVIAVMRLKAHGDDVVRRLGFSRDTIGGDLVAGLLVGAISLALAVVSLRLMSTLVPLPALGQLSPTALVFLGTVGAIAPGVGEELYYRGMMFEIGEGLRPAVLLVLSSAGFSLWHIGNISYVPHTFVLGLMLGALVLRTGRLAPAIIAHTAANVALSLLLVLGVEVL